MRGRGPCLRAVGDGHARRVHRRVRAPHRERHGDGTLAALRIHGVRTNVSLLREILRHPEFAAGNLSTHFINDHIRLDPQRTPAEQAAVLADKLIADKVI